MREALERELNQHPSWLPYKETGASCEAAPVVQETSQPLELDPQPRIYPQTAWGKRAEASRSQRFSRYQQMSQLQQAGLKQPEIARQLGISERTLSRWSSANGFAERKRRSGDKSILDPFTAYLQERWEAGCHNATHLYHEIQGQGYSGGSVLVANYLAPLRRGEAVAVRTNSQPQAPAATDKQKVVRYTARQASFLLIQRGEKLKVAQKQALKELQEQDEGSAKLSKLSADFMRMLREGKAEELEEWLSAVTSSGNEFPELQRFGNGIRQDYKAVKAGFLLSWSQGPVEGHNTRLKLIKRSMYGRAKLDLLRQKVLYVA